MKPKPKLLCIGDSPTVNTGFACVIRNLVTRWRPAFERIDIWGINYNGWPHSYPANIYPAGFGDWAAPKKMQQLFNLILAMDYTHIFVLCDTHNFTGESAKALREICDNRKIKLTFYYPVDSTLEKEWLGLAVVADHTITYTEYGRKQTVAVRPGLSPIVIPHGVDPAVFYPREDRESIRKQLTGDWLQPGDFFIVNVNRNERRKAPHHSLQILKLLRERGVNAKLLLHMPNLSPGEGTSLESLARQLGINDKHWSHSDRTFVNGNATAPESSLNELYNAADLVLSTSLGEGWGLSLTESAAAGCRMAAPDHTSCGEIARKFDELGQTGQFTLLPLATQCVANMQDSSRIRYPVDVEQAAGLIEGLTKAEAPARFVLNDAVKEWLNWDRVAGEFAKLMLS